jgi:hypothetical protein
MKAMALVALLLCTLLCTRPVAAAAGVGAAEERNVQVIETGPFGYVRWIEAPSASEKGKRYWVVPSYEYASWEKYAQFRNGYVVSRLTEPPRGIVDSYREAGGLLRMVTMAAGNRDLFIRGFRDVWHAVNESTGILGKGMANLSDPQKLYEFWKEKGIYDKYTPGERAFLNQVVMPAVAVAQWGLVGLGGAVTGASIVSAVTALLGITLGPLGFLAAGVVGTVAAVYIGHAKGTAVRQEEGDVNALHLAIREKWPGLAAELQKEGVWASPDELYWVDFDWNGVFPKVTLAPFITGTLAGLANTLKWFSFGGTGTGIGAGLVGMLAGAFTADKEYDLVATYNAYGIPELVETPVPPAVWGSGAGERYREKSTWELIYSLSR